MSNDQLKFIKDETFGSIEYLFSGKPPMEFDACFNIAEAFNSLSHKEQAGWYTASISYFLDENGEIQKIDEVKITYTGDTDLIGIQK